MNKAKAHIKKHADLQVDLIKRVFQLVKLNFWPLFLFVAIAAALNIFVAKTLTTAATRLTLWAAGAEYLCTDNLLQVLLTPVGIVSIILLILCGSAIAIFEVGGLIHACFLSQAGKKVSFGAICAHGFEATRRSLDPKNVLIIPFMLAMMPFTNAISFAYSGIGLSIPEFIRDAISANGLYSLMLLFGAVALFVFAFVHIYSIPEFIIERKNFYQSCRDTWSGFRRHCIATPLSLALCNATVYLFCVGISAIVSFIIIKAGAFVMDTGLITQQDMASTYIFNLVAFASVTLTPVFSMGALTVLYTQMGLCNVEVEEYEKSTEGISFTVPERAMVITLLIACTICNATLQAGDIYTLSFEENSRPAIVAHRGDSIRAPENTEPAFQSAIDHGLSNGIELDVHQTKDGVIIVSHDENLKRVSGKDINVSDITYDELQQLDTGSWYSSDYSYVRCMTLDSALKLMKGKVAVQIELKPTGKETNLEESVIKIIRDNDMVDNASIICMNSETLKRVKELDSDIHTAYCTALAWESIEKMSFSDDFTVEESNITSQLVRRVHAAGKKIYAWTCNTEDEVQYLVDCGVDGIVTDDPMMIYSTLDRVKYNGGIPRSLRILLNELINGV